MTRERKKRSTYTHTPLLHTYTNTNRTFTYSREKKREVLRVISAATNRQEQALTRERRGDSLAISKEGAIVFTSICRLLEGRRGGGREGGMMSAKDGRDVGVCTDASLRSSITKLNLAYITTPSHPPSPPFHTYPRFCDSNASISLSTARLVSVLLRMMSSKSSTCRRSWYRLASCSGEREASCD